MIFYDHKRKHLNKFIIYFIAAGLGPYRNITMKITILTLGTRGDVQPFAALGQALAIKGHEVTLSSARNFKALVEEHQLKFHPIEADYEEIINSEEGKKILNGNVFAINRNFKNLIYPLIEGALNEFYRLAQASDLIIYRSKTLADVFIDKVNCKAIKAAVIPAMEETIAFANPSMSGFKLPDFLNRWTYKINNLRYPVLSRPIKNFHLQNGLKHKSTTEISMPSIYGISSHFLERPSDWPENHHLTGFWFSDNYQPLDEETIDFLKKGKPPILLTFGSMPAKTDVSALILRAEKELHQRFIIVSGWGNWKTAELKGNKNIHMVTSAPYKLLLPKVKAMVHHGGIGTTAECLRAGKPMFICPVLYPLGDQSFWGELAYKKGVAVESVPLSKLTPDIFIKRLKQLIGDKQLYKNSQQMAFKINAENGLEKAVSVIEEIMNERPVFKAVS